MSNQTHEVGEITDHAGHITNLGDEIDTISSQLASSGVGDYLMYGVVVGAVAYPVLSGVAAIKSRTIHELSAVLHSTGESLQCTAQDYDNVESVNADSTHTISQQAAATPRPI